MRKKDLEKIKKDWANPEEARIIEKMEKSGKKLLLLQKELLGDIKALEKIAEREESEELLLDLEEATYSLEAIEENLDCFFEEVKRSRLPEACNLLTVLEEKVGSLK